MSEASSPFPKRRSRGRRWWIAGIILLLIAVFPTIEGPVTYAHTRDWLPVELYRAIYRSLDFTFGRSGLVANLRDDYRGWWEQLAVDHRGYVSSVTYRGDVNKINIRFDYFINEGMRGLNRGKVNRNGERYWWFELGDGRRLIVEEKRVLWNGEVIAEIPKNTNLVEIKYIEDEADIEINGHSFPLDE